MYRYMFLLAVSIYIPYSLLINELMCSLASSTCCKAVPVEQRVNGEYGREEGTYSDRKYETEERTLSNRKYEIEQRTLSYRKYGTEEEPLLNGENGKDEKTLSKRKYGIYEGVADELEVTGNVDACSSVRRNGQRIWLVVGVISYVNFFEPRVEIRKTYGDLLKRLAPGPVCLVFVLGDGGPRFKNAFYADRLKSEMREHGDIIQMNREEAYKDLVFKSFALLKWADDHVSHFDFLLKINDDVILNVPNFIHKLLLFSSNPRFIMGHIISNVSPIRDNISRYYIPWSQYNDHILPNYMNGPSYVITKDLVHDLLEVFPTVPLIHVEDVFITGVLPSFLGDVTHIGNCGFSRRKDNLYGMPLSSVSVHGFLSLDVILAIRETLLSTQALAAALL